MELNIIVNKYDEVIGYKNRRDITSDDIYRVSALWIENSKGEYLLAQRGFMKKNGPGKWSAAVAGTVEKGESYEDNIYKEAQEEIGLTGHEFKKDIKLLHHAGSGCYFFCQWYTLQLDLDPEKLVLEEGQVESVRWFSKEEIVNLLENNPTIISGIDFIKQRMT